MSTLVYRRARVTDIPAMAEVRAQDWGTQSYWRERIAAYLAQERHPRESLLPRVAFLCKERGRVVGLIAGHLTRRFGCDAELEWLSVRPRHRNRGIAAELLRRLFRWFVAHNAVHVCVDVEPSNQPARRFYQRHGARDLRTHWMIWEDVCGLLHVPQGTGVEGISTPGPDTSPGLARRSGLRASVRLQRSRRRGR